MVKEIRDFSVGTDIVQVPGFAPKRFVAQRTHDEFSSTLTDFVRRSIVIDGEYPIKKYKYPNYGGG